jgi:hypothetical protein
LAAEPDPRGYLNDLLPTFKREQTFTHLHI